MATIPGKLKLCQREEIVIIQVCGERVLSENRTKRERLSDQKRKKKTRSKRHKGSQEKCPRKLERTPARLNTVKGTRKRTRKT